MNWQLGVSVFPSHANAAMQVGSRAQLGEVDGVEHRLFKFSTPGWQKNSQSTLIVSAPGYKTSRQEMTIGPDNPNSSAFPHWPELPAVHLVEGTDDGPQPPIPMPPGVKLWQLGVSVSPTSASVEMQDRDGRLATVVNDGPTHRLIKFTDPPFKPNNEGKLVVANEGYVPSIQTLPIGPSNPNPAEYPHWPELPMVTLQPVVIPVPPDPPHPEPPQPQYPLTRLRINGIWFEEQDGTPHLRIACSDFAMIRLLHEGVDITAGLKQRKEMGFTELRVFSMMCGNLGRLLPEEVPDYYTHLVPTFLDLAEAAGLRVELTSLVDANDGAHWSQTQRLDHHNRLVDILGSRLNQPHFSERVNENDQGMNATSMEGFTIPTNGVWACSGSYGADVIPPDNPNDPNAEQWHYGTIHPARPPDWPRKAVHNPDEDIAGRCKIPATANELCRPDQGRGPVLSDHFETGAGISLFHNGGCFHSETGKFSRYFVGGDDLRCAQEYIRGARLIPLKYRYGQYTAGHLTSPGMPIESHPTGGNDPLNWNSRAYARILGNEACAVVLQKTADFPQPAHAINGWTIVHQVDSVYFCTR